MTYEEINQTVDIIKPSELLITVFACEAGTALPFLSQGSSPRVFADIGAHWFYFASTNFNRFGYNLKPGELDLDKNGYVSVQESINTANEFQIESANVTYGDLNNLASNIYFGDFEIDTSQPKPYVSPYDGGHIWLCVGEMSANTVGCGFSRFSLMSPGPELTFYLGETVNMTLYNVGALPQSWEIRTQPNINGELLFNSTISSGGFISQWQWSSVSFNASKVGKFYYICPTPNQPENVIWGQVEVIDLKMPYEQFVLLPVVSGNATTTYSDHYQVSVVLQNIGTATATIDPSKVLFDGKLASDYGVYAPTPNTDNLLRVKPGESLTLQFSFKNDGNSPWRPGGPTFEALGKVDIIIQTEAGTQFWCQACL